MSQDKRDYAVELQTWVEREQREHGLVEFKYSRTDIDCGCAPARPQQEARIALAMLDYAGRLG